MFLSKKSLLINFITTKFLPIFSVAFFVAIKLFLNFLLWKGRILPPEPGDSFNYLRYIEQIKSGFLYLTSSYTAYSFILGNIARIFSLTAETVFKYSFLVGPILLALVLWFLFKKLKFNWVQMSLSFVFLAFYTGHGSFHGFYWVVPSFFLLVAFFYLFANIISNEKINWWFVGFVSFIYPLIHGMGIFSLMIFIFYLGFYLFFSFLSHKMPIRKFIQDLDKKIIFRTSLICIIILISYCLVTFLLPKINISANNKSEVTMSYSNMVPFLNSYQVSVGNLSKSYNFFTNPILSENNLSWQNSSFGKIILHKIEDVFNQQQSQLMKKTIEITVFRFNNFKFNYLDIICPNLFFLFCWMFIFYILFRYRENKILALFFSVLSFSFISSLLHYNGFRSLLFLWPVTYILVIYSFALIFNFIKIFFDNFKLRFLNQKILVIKWLQSAEVFLRIVFVILVVLFFICNIAYSFWYVELKNNYLNFNHDFSAFSLISSKYSGNDSMAYFDDYLTISAFLKDSAKETFELRRLQKFDIRNQLKSSDDRRIIVFLEDDSIYNYDENNRDTLWHQFLLKISKFISFKENPYNDNNLISNPLSLQDKLKSFYFDDIPNTRKELYNDGRYYVFELLPND